MKTTDIKTTRLSLELDLCKLLVEIVEILLNSTRNKRTRIIFRFFKSTRLLILNSSFD